MFYKMKLFIPQIISVIRYNNLPFFMTNDKLYSTLSSKERNINVVPVSLAYVSYEATENVTDAPPLIIMHGLFGSKANWTTTSRALLKETNPNRKIIVVDARNHGDSPHSPYHTYHHLAADVKRLMEEMDIQKSALIGHSMGGRAMMCTALKYPHLVEKLICVDISPISSNNYFHSVSTILDAMRKVAFPKSVSLANAKLSADLQLSKSVHNKLVRNFLLTNILQESNGKYTWRLNIPALFRNKNLIFSFPASEGMIYQGPTLFIGGRLSDFIQKNDHLKILSYFPNAEFHTIENAGHWIQTEKPQEFLKICIDFLNKDHK